MKEEIKELRKCQRFLDDLKFPGYPTQLSIVIDIEEKVGWFNLNHKKSLKECLKDLFASLIYGCLGAKNTSKRTFVIDQHLEDYEKYLTYKEEDFYIDNLNAWRMYFSINSVLANRSKGYVFAYLDEDMETVEVKVFDNLEQITTYVKEYWDNED